MTKMIRPLSRVVYSVLLALLFTAGSVQAQTVVNENGDFEGATAGQTTGITNWTLQGTDYASYEVVADPDDAENLVLKVTITDIAGITQVWDIQALHQNTPVTAGTQYQASVRVRAENPTEGTISLDPGHAPVYDASVSGDEWQTIQTDPFTIDEAGTLQTAVHFGNNGNADGQIFYIDDLQIVALDDGGDDTAEILNGNGGFESFDLGPAANSTEWYFQVTEATDATLTIVDDPVHEGSRALSVEVAAIAGANLQFSNQNIDVSTSGPGTYRYSGWARASEAGAQLQVVGDQQGGSFTWFGNTTATLTTEWTEITLEFEVPAVSGEDDVTAIRATHILKNEANVGKTIYLDDVRVWKVEEDGDDGMTIAEAREAGVDATVTVEGVVTRAMGAFTYIQDETGGLTIRQTEGDFFDDVADGTIVPGTQLTVTGTLSEFASLLQINSDDLTSYEVLGTTDVPAPQAVTLQELTANGESYEAELIEVGGLTTDSTGTFAEAASYGVADATGEGVLRIPNAGDSEIDGTNIPTSAFTFTGVVGQFHFDDPAAGYQLMAIGANDVQVDPVELAHSFDAINDLGSWKNSSSDPGYTLSVSEDAAEGTGSLQFDYNFIADQSWGGSVDIQGAAPGGAFIDMSDRDGIRFSYKVLEPVDPQTDVSFAVKLVDNSTGDVNEYWEYRAPAVITDDSGEWQVLEIPFESFAIPDFVEDPNRGDDELNLDAITAWEMQVIVSSTGAGNTYTGSFLLDDLGTYVAVPVSVANWGFNGDPAGWTLEVGEPGNVTISGEAPPSNWVPLRGEFGTIEPAIGEALVVTGQLELIGGGLPTAAGTNYPALRYGVYQDNGSAGNLVEGSWSGTAGNHYGYLFTAPSGSGGTVGWTSDGSLMGTFGGIRNRTWYSTRGANDYVLGDTLHQPAGALASEGTYDFAFSFAPQEGGGMEVRFYLIKDDGDYYWAGSAIDDSLQTTSFNSVNFAISADVSATGLALRDVTVDLGEPIEIPAAPTPDAVAPGDVPHAFALEQNYPNPFNPTTTIEYVLEANTHVTLTVYNALGQRVATLVDAPQAAGQHRARFDARGLASGMYFYRITAGDHIMTRQMTLVK